MADSPAKTTRPLEMHSPNRPDGAASPVGSPMKLGTPAAPRRPTADDMENQRSFALSPIGRVDFGTPAIDMHLETPAGKAGAPGGADTGEESEDDDVAGYLNDLDQAMIDNSFPEDGEGAAITSPLAADSNQNDQADASPEGEGSGEEDEDEECAGEAEEETAEQRAQREIEESEALARQLMAEEAMASYAQSTNYLRDNADQFSQEDLAALEAAMAEEDPEASADEGEGEGDEGEGGEESNLSYDALLRLGERIGDVKSEMWALSAAQHIAKLPTLPFHKSMAEGKEENHTERKCQVCQCEYEDGETLRKLPCGHCFHKECIDEWLGRSEGCAFCRRSIVPEK